MSINKVFIVGNITRDPEKRKAGETPLIQFGIAVNEWRKEGEQYTNYFDVTVWGNRAVKLADMLHKGQKVTVEGRLRYETWERDGQKRSKVTIIADNVEFMSAKESKPNKTEDDIPW